MLFHWLLWIVGGFVGVMIGVLVAVALLSILVSDLWHWLRR